MKTKIKTLLTVLITLGQLTLSSLALADVLPIRAYSTDAVAGFSASLRTSHLDSDQAVLFVVEKPDGSVIRVPAEVKESGIAEAEFYGHHTKMAGQYRVAVTYANSKNASPQSNFLVVPAEPSMSQSTLRVSQAMVKAGEKEESIITITLYDAYRNPVKDHQMKLISSRGEDTIRSLTTQAVTDKSGRINFRVTSAYPGISVFSALDSTTSQILSDRAEIVFIAAGQNQGGMGGNSLQANLLDSQESGAAPEVLTGPVHHFDIVDLPEIVKVGQEQYLTVIARDKDGNMARNYTGTILISVPEDENAVLPNNGQYTFKESDQGKFTFNLALQFSTLGKQVVQIFDKDNWRISGEANVEVVPVSAAVENPKEGSDKLKIKSPADGAELGTNFLIITGQGSPNINLKLFDNDVKIIDSETDLEGFFSAEVKNLENGMHTFYVMSEAGETSSPINVRIDSLPPVINQFEIYPEGSVLPGAQVSITVYSEPKLDEVKIRIQGVEQRLSEQAGAPGEYVVTLPAPSSPGNFPIDIVLRDALANRAEMLNKAIITVQEAAKNPPQPVAGLTGEAQEGKVVLQWEPLKNHERLIKNYRILYGTHFEELNQTMDVSGAAETKTIIENLENNHQYFFAVQAIDSEDLAGEKSVVIALTPVAPTPLAPPVILPGSNQTSSQSLQGQTLNRAVSLTFAPSNDFRLAFYRVYFGLKSGVYDDYVTTPNAQPSLVIPDLINGLPYYFAMAAIDANGGEISPLSNELMLVPGITSLSASHLAAPYNTSAAPSGIELDPQLSRVPRSSSTGTEALWVLLASLIFAHFFSQKKRRLLNHAR